MSITEKLSASKNALSALLEYANNATGQADADIGEAIRTLVDGYGQGGGGGTVDVVELDWESTAASYTKVITELNREVLPTALLIRIVDGTTPVSGACAMLSAVGTDKKIEVKSTSSALVGTSCNVITLNGYRADKNGLTVPFQNKSYVGTYHVIAIYETADSGDVVYDYASNAQNEPMTKTVKNGSDLEVGLNPAYTGTTTWQNTRFVIPFEFENGKTYRLTLGAGTTKTLYPYLSGEYTQLPKGKRSCGSGTYIGRSFAGAGSYDFTVTADYIGLRLAADPPFTLYNPTITEI